MIRTFILLLSLFMLVSVADARPRDRGYGPPRDPAGRFIEMISVESKYMAPQRVTVWLPPGYYQEDRDYPVIYMQDGERLFDGTKDADAKSWGVDTALVRLIRSKQIAQVIVVGIWSPGADRYRQYLPQKLYDMAAPDAKGELKGRPLLSDAYMNFIVDDLKPMIDASYRTREKPQDTSIIGAGMGGLLACYALIERPLTFGRAACLNPDWALSDTDVSQDLSPLWTRWIGERLGKPNGRKLWLQAGQSGNSIDAPYQQAIIGALKKSGWKQGRDFEAREAEASPAQLDPMLIWLIGR